MPGAEKIVNRIIEEARQEAAANIARAEAEAMSIMESARKEADAKRYAILEKAQREAEDTKKRLLAVAGLEARKQKLQARQEIIEETFGKALDRLCSLKDIEYQSILINMIVNSLESGNEEIILSERDKKRLDKGFIDAINSKAREKGLNSNVSLSEKSANILGGFILKSGDIEVNNSFEAILRAKRDELEVEAAKLLL